MVVAKPDAVGPALPKPAQKTINVALQGGGAHGAFAWGALDKLLEDGRLAIEGISGTSAGSMNAAVLAFGLAKGGPEEARQRLHDFWKAISNAGRFYCPVERLPRDAYWAVWNPLTGSLPEPTVQETGFAVLVVALPPPPERPLPDAQELHRLVAAKNIPKLDHSHTLMGFRPAHLDPRKARDLPDRSCAT